MPDISLLQQEEYNMQEEESRIPGYFATGAFVLLVIVIGGYVALYEYNNILTKRAIESEQKANIQVKESEETIKNFEKIGVQAKVLKELREAHTIPNNVFSVIEQSTHPAVSFSQATIDIIQGTISMTGIASHSKVLVRQIEIYKEKVQEGIRDKEKLKELEMKKEKTKEDSDEIKKLKKAYSISSFRVENIRYMEKPIMGFTASLTILKN